MWFATRILIPSPNTKLDNVYASKSSIHVFHNNKCRPIFGKDCIQDSLLSGLVSGSLDLVSSHHAAYNSQQRALGRDNFQEIPKGITGIEERMVVLWQKTVKEGSMSKQRFVEATSAGAAKLLNIFPQKGAVVVGSDADIVIWNPNQTKTITSEEHLTKCDVNIFQDLVCSGGPEYVIFKGRMVLDQGTFRSVLSRVVKFDRIPNTFRN